MIIQSSKQFFFLLIGVITVVCSCSQNRVPQPIPTSESSHETAKSPIQESWSPSPIAGATRYLIQDSSTIAISGDSSQSVPIQSSAIYSMTFATTGDSFMVIGKMDSLITNAHEHSGKKAIDMTSISEFHAAISKVGRATLLSGGAPSTCGEGINPVATRIFDLLPTYPAKPLKVGGEWTDTISITICRGRTALIQKTIRQYQLTDFEKLKEQNIAKIHRVSSTSFTGTSTDSKNHLSTTGSGFSETTIWVDQITGMLVQSDGRSQATLSISTTRGVYPFSQTVSTHVEARR